MSSKPSSPGPLVWVELTAIPSTDGMTSDLEDEAHSDRNRGQSQAEFISRLFLKQQVDADSAKGIEWKSAATGCLLVPQGASPPENGAHAKD